MDRESEPMNTGDAWAVTERPAGQAADPTLDELRLILAPAIADAAVFDGWSRDAVVLAAEQEGFDPDIALLAFKDGKMAMIEAWIEQVDAAMIATFPPEELAKLKVRDRIRLLITFRLEQCDMREEALRRALAIMALPQNAARTLRRSWRSADLMWRLAGDTATDYNHYTKRTILASLYGATLAVFVDDRSEGKADTYAFLDRRLDGVMRFEKLKAKLTSGGRDGFSVLRFLGRLRYPER
jgi:ubiquinone biosynthesis protein COQ9